MLVKLNCGHDIDFPAPTPALHDVVPCHKCGRYEYSTVIDSTNRLHRSERYYVRCEQNDYQKYYPTETGTYARVDGHIRRTGHHVRIYDNHGDELITVRSPEDLARPPTNVIAS